MGEGDGVFTLNDGRVYIQLKPNNQRDPIGEVIARLRTNLAKGQGITLYMQATQDITIGARLNKTQFQYTLNDADPGELNQWAALFLDKIKSVPGITDVVTDQLNAGPMLDITIKREVASSYGILPYTIDNTLDDAFGQRIVSTIYTTLQQYHVILEVDPKFHILLIGIVKKNGIMLVDFALQAEQNEGLTTDEAIYQACIKRFRPILMTTMAALLGGVPMMVGTGVGSEIRQPLGYAIVGGLALSQVLTLYTTPVIYIYLDRLQTRLFGEKKEEAAASAQSWRPPND